MIVDQNLQKDEYCKHVRMINLSKTFLGILEQNTYNRIYTCGAYGIKLYFKIWVIAKNTYYVTATVHCVYIWVNDLVKWSLGIFCRMCVVDVIWSLKPYFYNQLWYMNP